MKTLLPIDIGTTCWIYGAWGNSTEPGEVRVTRVASSCDSTWVETSDPVMWFMFDRGGLTPNIGSCAIDWMSLGPGRHRIVLRLDPPREVIAGGDGSCCDEEA